MLLAASDVQLYVYGSLKTLAAFSSESPLRLKIERSTPLEEILKRQRIPINQVQLAMVNHRAVSKKSMIAPGDRVALFPEEYPIFADWNDFR